MHLTYVSVDIVFFVSLAAGLLTGQAGMAFSRRLISVFSPLIVNTFH